MRVGLFALSGTEGLYLIRWSDAPSPPSTLAFGAALDACPFGVAVVSTRKIDLILSVCGELNLASAGQGESRLWLDGGGVGHLALQIGRKRHYRGFI